VAAGVGETKVFSGKRGCLVEGKRGAGVGVSGDLGRGTSGRWVEEGGVSGREGWSWVGFCGYRVDVGV